ncbi:DUF4365 domain-containing protein [Candidatus Enterococcus lemimoniae]|uniref:DUF4365 domain-containing protein n=1 Tax=Candidatus Enterococcus lemimoniae TaxID=1834167 RepID=A0ABZ2T4I7_9ENTE|nr:DUF4365 domain-containing protein [Enterococcus sp. 12C11_DIV0727]OTO68455.1 hypothetical protein A5866_000653 [Enterococcus sp. 12C11_DIV0727]
MALNQEQIEMKAVNLLETTLQETSTLQTDFRSNDKTPIVDGSIRVYQIEEGQNRSKKSFVSQVFVQIKGTTLDRIAKTKKYSVDVDDLNAFKKIGGGIYFVVYIKKNEEKIFFKTLSPLDLKEMDLSKKTKTLTFYEFPSDPKEMNAEVKNFILHRDMQTPNVLSLDIPFDKFNKLTTKIVASKNRIDEVLNRGIPLYYTKTEGINIPVGMTIPNSKFTMRELSVRTLKGLKLEYKVFSRENKIVIYIDNFIKMTFDNGKFNFNFDLTQLKSFDAVVRGGDIVSEILTNGYFIDESLIELPKIFNKEHSEELKKVLKKISLNKELYLLLKNLDIYTDFDLFSLSELNLKDLNSLLNISRKNTVKEIGIKELKLEDRLYYLLVGPDELENMYSIDDRYVMQIGTDGVKGVLPSLSITQNLEYVANFSFAKTLSNIENLYSNDKRHEDYITIYALAIIETYDRSKKIEFLELAKSITELLYSNSSSNINLINYLQVISRERDLSIFEKNQLFELEKVTDMNEEKICIDILLSRNNVKKKIDSLEKIERDKILSWPIIRLLKY